MIYTDMSTIATQPEIAGAAEADLTIRLTTNSSTL
jgi:hypothetical protein